MKELEKKLIEKGVEKTKIEKFRSLVRDRLEDLFRDYYEDYNNFEECFNIIYLNYLEFIEENSNNLDYEIQSYIQDNIEDLEKDYYGLIVIVGHSDSKIETDKFSSEAVNSITMLSNNIIKENQKEIY